MRIALIGYGKMGKAIEKIALARGHEIVLRIQSANLQDRTIENLQKADVAIEFTGPEAALDNIQQCLLAGTPVVSGSTGWLAEWNSVAQTCTEKKGAFLYASNFSVGVNIFFEINKQLAALMSNQMSYDVQITEIHHTQKKDAPSGTAITLAEQVLEKLSRKRRWVNHPSKLPEDLAIISERTDPAPGTHIVDYQSGVDTISITHTAHNREGFAIGAVLAAEFLQHKTGIFGMKEVLGF
jgi:4-hydroxy-tetrahydrodipicolinate reductase